MHHQIHRRRGLRLLLTTSLLASMATAPATADADTPGPIAFLDFEDGDLGGWTIESERVGAMETRWDVEERVGHLGTSGLRLVWDDLAGDEQDGYADLAHTTFTSPWFETPSDVPVHLSLRAQHEIERDADGPLGDGAVVEWLDGPDDPSWDTAIHPGLDTVLATPDDDPIVLTGYADDFVASQATISPGSSSFRVRIRFFSDPGNSTATDLNLQTGAFAGLQIDDLRVATTDPGFGLDDNPRERTWPAPHARERAGRGVVALTQVNGSIDPYHHEFRDRSRAAYVHPSLYLDGYPEDAKPLWLSLDAPDHQTAIDADAEVWASIDPNTLYWVPGTRIVGAYAMATDDQLDAVEVAKSCTNGCLRSSRETTWAASRAVGATTGACADCLLAVFTGKAARGNDEAADHAWIDAVVHVLTAHAVDEAELGLGEPYPGMADAAARIVAERPLFTAAPGNDNGISPLPTPLGTGAVPGTVPANVPGVITVGGHDSGHVSHWNAHPTMVVADACRTRVAVSRTMDETADEGFAHWFVAAPWAAGQAAALAQSARELLGDRSTGTSGGIVADGLVPDGMTSGPLADGVFTQSELEELLLASASPRPVAEPGDGPRCEVGDYGFYGAFASPELAWSNVPADVPAYVNVGYGGIDSTSLARAVAVLHGEQGLADRSDVDAWFAMDGPSRQAFQEAVTLVEDLWADLLESALRLAS